MIKDIVVNLGLGASDRAGDYAISLATAFEAHVLGIAFAYDPVIPAAVMGGIPPEFIDAQRTEADGKARMAVARFEKAAKSAGISAESLVIHATFSGASDRLAQMARCFDIAVVGQPEHDSSSAEDIVGEGVLFDSGRPVIVVPYIHQTGFKADRVMVCWDGNRTAARAIADSMPLLQKGQADRNCHGR